MTTKYDRLEEIDKGHAICGCPEHIKQDAAEFASHVKECQNNIRYYLNLRRAPENTSFPNDSAYRELFRTALNIVEETCDVTFVEVDDYDDAIVYIQFGGTTGSVLAWSNVGFRCNGVAQQLYGTKWNWTRDFLLTVILHEIGHLLGLPHDQCYNANREPNVMCWRVQEYVLKYDSVTAKKLQNIYGEPKPKPDPQPPQPPVPPQPQPDPEPVPPPTPDPEWPDIPKPEPPKPTPPGPTPPEPDPPTPPEPDPTPDPNPPTPDPTPDPDPKPNPDFPFEPVPGQPFRNIIRFILSILYYFVK